MDLAAYWYSLRYQRPRQFAGRARYWLGWKFYPRFPGAVRSWCERAAASARPRAAFSWQPRPAPTSARPPAEPIDWNPPGASLLELFRLHYFDWAERCAPEVFARHIESWIDANPPGSWPAWHPYPTSLRIVNWIRASASGASLPPRAIESLALQGAFLERNLEFHLGGNHLLENARALLAAGLYFEGAAAGLDLLCRELADQVLPDGGHFERSPYYHDRMLALVLDTIDLLAQNGCAVPPSLNETANRMSTFARAMRHQDGGLPLFHDALSEDATVSDAGEGAVSFPASGYYILDTRHGRLIADYGAPGSSYNPGHQHAGIFSFEISSGERRVVVDSGTATYNPGPERDHLRSTAAHNTVRIGGCDQFQLWGGFRVGRRAWVRHVEERRGPDRDLLSAAHDGYRRLGVEHRRTIVSIPDAGWLIVDDVSGRGAHRLESFLHLAPGITPQVHGERICLHPIGWVLVSFGFAAPAEVIADRYSPAIGIAQPSQTLVFRAASQLPRRFGYILGPEGAMGCLTSPAAGLAEGYYRQPLQGEL